MTYYDDRKKAMQYIYEKYKAGYDFDVISFKVQMDYGFSEAFVKRAIEKIDKVEDGGASD